MLVVVVGPTAVGKTSVSIQLAQHFKAEIISADSRQIFREITVGTAKPTSEELITVKHHFINSHSIHEPYDAAQFGKDALRLIHKLFEQFDYVILCGGSGLYIKAVLQGFDDIPPVAENVRAALKGGYDMYGLPWLQEQMQMLDTDHYSRMEKENPQRLMRALEVKIGTGKSIATFQQQSKIEHPFNVIKIGLELPRDILYHRIDERMDAMISAGLFEEAASLYQYKEHNALQTVGYGEVFNFIDGHYNKEEAIRLLKRNSRRYAKRQLTWFKRMEGVNWFSPDQLSSIFAFVQGA